MQIKTITILGCGAVGLYYGAKLKKSGMDVRYLIRSDFDTIKEKGIFVHSIDGNFHDSGACYQDPLECSGSDLILVALKTTAKNYLLETLPKLIRPDSGMKN